MKNKKMKDTMNKPNKNIQRLTDWVVDSGNRLAALNPSHPQLNTAFLCLIDGFASQLPSDERSFLLRNLVIGLAELEQEREQQATKSAN